MGKLDDRYVDKAKKLVTETFPEMADTEPSVSEKRSHCKGMGRSVVRTPRHQGQYVLTFEKDVSLPGGHTLKRLVRVTMDESGEVIKVTSSK